MEVQAFHGLLIDFVRQNDAKVIVRGLRAITEFEYELQMAQTNRVIAPEIDTIIFDDQPEILLFKFQHCEGNRGV